MIAEGSVIQIFLATKRRTMVVKHEILMELKWQLELLLQ